MNGYIYGLFWIWTLSFVEEISYDLWTANLFYFEPKMANICMLCCSLDMSDKVEQPQIPDGYGVSIAVHCLLEMMNSVRIIIIGEDNSGGVEESNAPLKGTQPLQGSLAPKGEDMHLGSLSHGDTVRTSCQLLGHLVNCLDVFSTVRTSCQLFGCLFNC